MTQQQDNPQRLKATDLAKLQVVVEVLYSSAIAPEYFEFVKKIRTRMQQEQNMFRPSEVVKLVQMYKIVTQRGPVTTAEFEHAISVLAPNKMIVIEDEDRDFVESIELKMSLREPLEIMQLAAELPDLNQPRKPLSRDDRESTAEVTQEDKERIVRIYNRYKHLLHHGEM